MDVSLALPALCPCPAGGIVLGLGVDLDQATQKAEDRMKITEDLVKEREMIISSLEAELTSYKNEVLFRGRFVSLPVRSRMRALCPSCPGELRAACARDEFFSPRE